MNNLLKYIDVPNSGRGLVTLPKRMEWDVEFRRFVADLDSRKPVVICGDLNVAHKAIGQYKVHQLIDETINDQGILIQISPIPSRINGMPASLRRNVTDSLNCLSKEVVSSTRSVTKILIKLAPTLFGLIWPMQERRTSDGNGKNYIYK